MEQSTIFLHNQSLKELEVIGSFLQLLASTSGRGELLRLVKMRPFLNDCDGVGTLLSDDCSVDISQPLRRSL